MVHNMAPAYAVAKYEIVWISTSRILASTPILLDFVRKLEPPDVGMVHQTPYYADQSGFLGALEKVCFGCSISRNQIALNQLGIVCFVGMSYVFKKSVLDELGGLAYYGKYLAEDFFMSNAIHARGYRLVMSDFPALQNVATTSIRAYANRMTRWLRLRVRMIPFVAGVLEPLSEAITIGLLFAVSLNYLFELPISYVLLVHFTVWILLDYTLLRSLQNGRLPFSFPMFLLAWLSRELLVYVIFIRALYNPSVITWGRYSYRVHMGGTTTRIPPSISPRRVHKPSVTSSDLNGHQNHTMVSHSPVVMNHNSMSNGNHHHCAIDTVNGAEPIRFKLFPSGDVYEIPMSKYLHKLSSMTKKNGYKYSKLEEPALSTVSTPQIEA
ncbi:Ceramide glucosyltransferase-B [Fasciolopsis buskii]|uniref:ceramide glucosyltransferase n=1 Tax=Fasciolopsis buskii TaxID=27845 RepID=A0A8E0RW18_9TREM|nr:Ceramide glucosyltransferase-B [Fasciolopsis buski]